MFIIHTQIYKVIKPGTYFSTYEWLRTPKYDAGNASHVAVVDGVAEGNALPAVRTVSETLAAGAQVRESKLGVASFAVNDQLRVGCAPHSHQRRRVR